MLLLLPAAFAASTTPVRFSFGLGGAVEAQAQHGVSLAAPIVPSLRMYFNSGFGSELQGTFQLYAEDGDVDLSLRYRVLWTPSPTARVVPMVHAGITIADRDVTYHGGTFGIGPTTGAAVEAWVLPWMALELGADVELIGVTGAPARPPGWSPDARAHLSLRFAYPVLPPPRRP